AGSRNEAAGAANLVANRWTHLAVTYNGSDLSLYVNGTLVSTAVRKGEIATSGNPLTIGSDPVYGQYFKGLIDDIRIYDTALTRVQIRHDMATPVGASSDASLVAAFPFDGPGRAVMDASGTGNN